MTQVCELWWNTGPEEMRWEQNSHQRQSQWNGPEFHNIIKCILLPLLLSLTKL